MKNEAPFLICPICLGTNVVKNGMAGPGRKQRYLCTDPGCGAQFYYRSIRDIVDRAGRDNAREIAQKLIKKSVPVRTLAAATGLSRSTIYQDLKQK